MTTDEQLVKLEGGPRDGDLLRVTVTGPLRFRNHSKVWDDGEAIYVPTDRSEQHDGAQYLVYTCDYAEGDWSEQDPCAAFR